MSRYRLLVSSEAIAFIAALCIAAIFVGAYYQRRMDTQDHQALRVAEQVYRILNRAPAPSPASDNAANPSAAVPAGETSLVTLARLKEMGLKDPAPVQVRVIEGYPNAWRVAVEHPQGLKRYLVTPQGIKEEAR
jgi:hypothetical protein